MYIFLGEAEVKAFGLVRVNTFDFSQDDFEGQVKDGDYIFMKSDTKECVRYEPCSCDSEIFTIDEGFICLECNEKYVPDR